MGYVFAVIALFVVGVAMPGCIAAAMQNADAMEDRLLIKDDYDYKASEAIPPAQLQEDLELLEYALRNGYGGTLRENTETLEKALKKLRKLGKKVSAPLSSKELCEKITKILYPVPDNHLLVWHMMTRCGTRLLAKKEKLPDVGANLAGKADIPWAVNNVRAGEHPVPVISITRCAPRSHKGWEGFLDAVEKAVQTAPAVIFDLRGNGGGDNHMLARAARVLYGQSFPSADVTVHTLQTPAAYALLANRWKNDILLRELQDKPVPEYLIRRFELAMSSYTLAGAGKLPGTSSTDHFNDEIQLDPGKFYQKPVCLLVDRECASSCESMLEMFEAHPFAKVIGSNTRGTIQFAPQDRHLVLPNSQIHLAFSGSYMEYRDGRFVERLGYTPDIRLKDGSDALEAALEYIEAELKE